jgi:hypothetical protein
MSKVILNKNTHAVHVYFCLVIYTPEYYRLPLESSFLRVSAKEGEPLPLKEVSADLGTES